MTTKLGRPPKAIKETNPQVQIGRHPQDEIDLIKQAIERSGAKHLSEWGWPILLDAAKKQLRG